MATKPKLTAKKIHAAIRKIRQGPDWLYAFPDDRNRLIEEAREIIASLLKYTHVMASDAGYELKSTLLRPARRWLKETKP